MSNGYFFYPEPMNEPVLNYAPGNNERDKLKKAYQQLKTETRDIPMFIGSQEVRTNNTVKIHPPHDLAVTLGEFHKGEAAHVSQAIEAALQAKESWANLSWEQRASIFLKAADLIAFKYRWELNAATMLCQSKNAYQAEIDSACELIDFLRFNVHYLCNIYKEQPISPANTNNRLEYRPLEGFVLAITPFNFTAIAGNLPTSAAMCGNTVVWKPANSQIYSAYVIMKILKEAGLPDGVINLVYSSGASVGDICFNHKDFAGVHFTGSTEVFQNIWEQIGKNIRKFKSYPRIVGETGGKDFIMVHKSAIPKVVAANTIRGAFEFQGQKCSAASRAYFPNNLADEIKSIMLEELATIKQGSTEDFGNFVNAVIDEKAFDNIVSYIEFAKNSAEAKIIAGGNYDKSKGYFIEPTIIETTNPKFKTMCEEIFGPVLTLYIYDENQYEETLKLLDETSLYALTGCIFAQDRSAVHTAHKILENAAGNFYVNDKPTGAVVGQQPFGGARGSGTNDKAGSALNLYRWISVRTVKETFVPIDDYRYPFCQS